MRLNAAARTVQGDHSRENQDSHFIRSLGVATVIGVFDGHGRFGGVASRTAASFFESYCSDAFINHILCADNAETATRIWSEVFLQAHDGIRRAILKESGGIHGADGVIYSAQQDGQTLDGGCTATVIICAINGILMTVNVGDSDAIACTQAQCEALCADHSPHSQSEFMRVGACGVEPKAQFVFDCRAVRPKSNCPPVFTSAGEYITYSPSERKLLGMYRKNVRGELATYLASPCPPHSASAMTRCLGSFDMHKYGISYVPDITRLCIEEPAVILVASDGLWDNWSLPDLFTSAWTAACSNSSMDPKISEAARAETIVDTILHTTTNKARTNFGCVQDDTTVVVIYSVPQVFRP